MYNKKLTLPYGWVLDVQVNDTTGKLRIVVTTVGEKRRMIKLAEGEDFFNTSAVYEFITQELEYMDRWQSGRR